MGQVSEGEPEKRHKRRLKEQVLFLKGHSGFCVEDE
jgi:hypothetical protein